MIKTHTLLEAFEELIFYSNHISFWQYSEEQTLRYSNCEQENFFDSLLDLDFCKEQIFEYCKGHRFPVQVCNSLNIAWMAEPCHDATGHFTTYIIGPIFTSSISIDTIKQYMDRSGLSLPFKNLLLRNLNNIPVISQNTFTQYAAMLHYCIYHEELKESIPFITEKPDTEMSVSILLQEKNGNHGTYYDELQFYQMIENGYVNYKDHLPYLFHGETGNFCPGDPLRDRQDGMIIGLGVAAMAAIRGGLTEEEAYSWRDSCIQQVEKCHTINDVFENMEPAYDELIQRIYIKKIQLGGYSPDTQRVIHYVEAHVQTKINWEEMAKDLGYNRTYICSKFKKETGMTLTDFSNQIKIKRAEFLLSSTTLDIADISHILGYTTPSYFAAMFRKLTGKTPKDYRNSHTASNEEY